MWLGRPASRPHLARETQSRSPVRETQSGHWVVGVGRGAGLPSGTWEELPCGLPAPFSKGEGLCPSSVGAASLKICWRKVCHFHHCKLELTLRQTGWCRRLAVVGGSFGPLVLGLLPLGLVLVGLSAHGSTAQG